MIPKNILDSVEALDKDQLEELRDVIDSALEPEDEVEEDDEDDDDSLEEDEEEEDEDLPKVNVDDID